MGTDSESGFTGGIRNRRMLDPDGRPSVIQLLRAWARRHVLHLVRWVSYPHSGRHTTPITRQTC
ncbi:hypothetical protein LQ51_02345 [Micromonospora sp. HK10]|nr:hypothetical protein LQ51_02345 [Micromonospora sp. HK10]